MSRSADSPDLQEPATQPPSTPAIAVAEPRDETIRALTSTVELLSAQLAAKDQALLDGAAERAEKDRAIQKLQQQLQTETAERATLEQRLREPDPRLAASESRIDELAAMVEQRDRSITAREWETAALRSEVAELQQTIAELQARLADIYASRTWVLSKKLWSARTRARKLIR